jgi:hypothetical protein
MKPQGVDMSLTLEEFSRRIPLGATDALADSLVAQNDIFLAMVEEYWPELAAEREADERAYLEYGWSST